MTDETRAACTPEEDAFRRADDARWRVALADDGAGDWREHWTLDGLVGTVANTPGGMELHAGPERADAHHLVLWTRTSFSGDLRVDYKFTRLDRSETGVNILYLQASGSGVGPYARDLATWAELRTVPAMRVYFDHLHTYHVSYATASRKTGADYVRARRYLPEAGGLQGTDLPPDYLDTGLFATGTPHRLTFVKRAQTLSLRVAADGAARYFSWRNETLPPILEGRVGLRLMCTRAARIRELTVSTL